MNKLFSSRAVLLYFPMLTAVLPFKETAVKALRVKEQNLLIESRTQELKNTALTVILTIN